MSNQTINSRKHKMVIKMIYDNIMNYDYEKDPKWSRVIELSKNRYLPLCKAIEIAEQEFNTR